MGKEAGNRLTELRRSNAAGIHAHQPSRSQSRRIAIAEGLDMPAFLDDNGSWPATERASGNDVRRELVSTSLEKEYADTSADDFDDLEPDDEDLAAIEAELAELDEDSYWADDQRFVDFDEYDYAPIEE